MINDYERSFEGRRSPELNRFAYSLIHKIVQTLVIYSEGPGITRLKEVPEFVSAIQDATNNFQEVPSGKIQSESRTWALKHCSFARFREQLSGIRTNFL